VSVLEGHHKLVSGWYSERLGEGVKVVRWGHFGVPVLLFPTAGGDAEECERNHLIGALAPLIDDGRIKVYSCDSLAGRTWLSEHVSGRDRAAMQLRFDAFVAEELVPAIRTDCRSEGVEIITAGASFGAFNALAALCRHPWVFRAAVCMSGSYDLDRWMKGEWSDDYYFCSPLHFVPNLPEGPTLHRLRERFVLLACGEGRWEAPGESWHVAHVLGQKGIPNRVDLWGPHVDHDWETWRRMLPGYLHDLVP
jgi:esterase/lipase superfamily enzyme